MPLLQLAQDNCELYEFLSCGDLPCHNTPVSERAVSTELLQPCFCRGSGGVAVGLPSTMPAPVQTWMIQVRLRSSCRLCGCLPHLCKKS